MPFYNVWIEHVALDLNQTFTYRHDAALERGMRVKVPFNHRELVAIVMEACEQPDDPSRIKDVIEVLDEQPLLNEELFGLAAYMADTYVSSMMSCFKAMLPPALRPATRRASVVYED